MECFELESLIDAPMQSYSRFWGFKLEEQRAGNMFPICIETFNCYKEQRVQDSSCMMVLDP